MATRLNLLILNDIQESAYYIRDADGLTTETLVADREAIRSQRQWRKAKHANVVLHKIARVLTERRQA